MKLKSNLIYNVICYVAGILTGIFYIRKTRSKHVQAERKRAERNGVNFRTLDSLLWVKQNGKSISEFFIINGYKKIAVYGLGNIGRRFIDELKDSSVEIAYVIDEKGESIEGDMKVYSPNDELPEVDAIIVTAVYYYKEINQKLAQKVEYSIISLDEVIKEIR